MSIRSILALAAISPLALLGCGESGSAHHDHEHDEEHAHEETHTTETEHTEETETTMNESDELGLAVGAAAPHATLTQADGSTTTLAALYAEGPIVLTFYRGGWCPYCNQNLKDWQAKLPELTDAGATLVALSPEKPDETAKTQAKTETSFLILADTDQSAAQAFGVAFTLDADTQEKYKGFGVLLDQHNADGSWGLPHPGTFVIDTEGTVRWKWVDTDYTKRADPDEVIEAVKAL